MRVHEEISAFANLGLRDEDLDLVVGGAAPGYPGLPAGTNLNLSPWSNRPFDWEWELVGATGQTPR